MLTCPGVPEFLGQTEIDEEQFVAVPADTHQEVIRLNISVDERLAVDVFDSADHLIGQHENGFDGEASRAEIEEVLERGTQQVHDENVMFLFLAIIPEKRKDRRHLTC